MFKKPIEITITGLKLVLSNVLERSKKQKKEMKEQLSKLKKEALSQYDLNLSKNLQNENPIYFSTLIQNLIQNAKLVIRDISAIFVYQIKDFELVKFGLTINSFQICKSSKRDESATESLRKNIMVSKVSIFFEFYDSFHMNKKFHDFENVNNERENIQKNEIPGSEEVMGDSSPLSKNYIVNNFDFSIELKLEYISGMALEMIITTSAILIFLKQRQLRHLTRAIESILYFRSDRPDIKPGIGNGTALWWKYACKF